MAAHDLRAELAAYEAELSRYEAREDSRASDVQAEIDRVTGLIRRDAAALNRRAEVRDAEGQDVLAAQLRVQARELLDGLPPAAEDTAESSPLETATTRKRGSRNAAR